MNILLRDEDAGDIDKVFPQKSREIFEFLRDYKVPDGKPQSKFGFGGKLLDKVLSFSTSFSLYLFRFAFADGIFTIRMYGIKKFMIEVIEETHTEWAKLVSGKVKGNYGMYGFRRVLFSKTNSSTRL